MATLSVGQPVKVYDNSYRDRRVHDGTVVKVGRKLVTLRWGGNAEKFRMDTGYDNGYGNSWFKTFEQAEADERRDAADRTLREAGIELRRGTECSLTGPQIEELAAIVKNMLSEKPADSESEIKGGGA